MAVLQKHLSCCPQCCNWSGVVVPQTVCVETGEILMTPEKAGMSQLRLSVESPERADVREAFESHEGKVSDWRPSV